MSLIVDCSKLRNIKKGLPQNKASPFYDWLVFNKVSLSAIFFIETSVRSDSLLALGIPQCSGRFSGTVGQHPS